MNTPSAQMNALRGISSPVSASPNPEAAKKKAIIEKGLDKLAPELNRDQKEIAAAKLLEGQGNNPTIKIGDKEITFESLAFQVANSIQAIESETDPMEEYFRWIYEAQQVITEMTTNGITPGEIAHREDFLGDLEQRESEMRVCMSLYASCNTPEAKARLAFLQVKLAKLMEIRSAIKTSTKEPVEAALDSRTNDQDKNRGESYCRFLDNCKERYDDGKLFSDDEYHLGLCCAQAVIAISAKTHISEADQLERDRYARYLDQRMKDMIYLRDMGIRVKDNSIDDMDRIVDIQQRIVAHQEMMNLVKIATEPQRINMSEKEMEDDRIRKDMCALVLECRRRDKPVPDRIMYKLGAKSFVPDYSLSEELLNKKENSKEDAIKRINELRGRQSILIKPQLKQSFNATRFNVLDVAEKSKMAEFMNERG